MYSHEFMRFLINYQTPEFDEKVDKQVVKKFNLPFKFNKLATVLLTNKK